MGSTFGLFEIDLNNLASTTLLGAFDNFVKFQDVAWDPVNNILWGSNLSSLFEIQWGSGVASTTNVISAAGTLGLLQGFDFDPSNGMGDNNVPEPATLALLGLGLAGVDFSRRKTK